MPSGTRWLAVGSLSGWNNEMDTYDFTLILDLEDDQPTDEVYESLFEAGLDDALVGRSAGVVFVDFSRQAEDPIEAIISAITDVESSAIGATVMRVEPDDLVTVADIARRLGRSSESIRLLIRGERGPGGFPAPSTRVGGRRSRVWRWADVAGWFEHYNSRSQDDPWSRFWSVIANVNDFLREREYSSRRDPVTSQVRRAFERGVSR